MKKIIVHTLFVLATIIIISIAYDNAMASNAVSETHYALTTDAARVEQIKLVKHVSPLQYIGRFLVTAYCPCEECSDNWGRQTSTGAVATEGRTIAVDPRVIPYGSIVVINGHDYRAEDCGGLIKGNRIDVFFDSHKTQYNFGVKYLDIHIRNGVQHEGENTIIKQAA